MRNIAIIAALNTYGVKALKLSKFNHRHKESFTRFVVVGALCLLFYGYLGILSITPVEPIQNLQVTVQKELTKTERRAECEYAEACRLLAEVGYFEARSEKADEAVAGTMFVVLNRRDYPDKWGNTLHKVIYQPWQFSYTHDGSLKKGLQERKAYDRMLVIAHYVWSGEVVDPTLGSDHYHTTSVSPSWRLKLKRTVKLGNHIYYRKTS